MYYEETLFETIMNLEYRDVPHYKVKKEIVLGNKQPRPREYNIKMQPEVKQKTCAFDLDVFYSDLVKEGSRSDTTIERRLQIRSELTLIRKQKRLFMKNE
ncbi:hypothetical protein Q9R46_16160 [Paenibacillus sp. RRE4]|uniref:hypothetical protein n=1 Tax=Paenibacillus sp. RRE4 TaxID=2962587 RepID=UPI002882A6FC|nr:hypothetical protein [Paenibacillus sp. RRE4]MDT0124194.1 hypothetical protein [Paenibacillus sp. RRE4]